MIVSSFELKVQTADESLKENFLGGKLEDICAFLKFYSFLNRNGNQNFFTQLN